MMTGSIGRFVPFLIALTLAGCASRGPAAPGATPATSSSASPRAGTAPPLPAVPLVRGPLAIRVQYPSAGATVQARDSTFLLGSVGHGEATLTIDGASVRVLPNGSFLAWVPVPSGSPPRWTLVAAVGADTARSTLQVRLPAPRRALPADGPLMVDTSSVLPNGQRTLRADELVRVSVRAPVNATAVLRLADGRARPMVNVAQALAGRTRNGGAPLEGEEVWGTDVPARELTREATIEVSRGADTVRLRTGTAAVVDPAAPRHVWLGAAPATVPDTDRVIIARPVPNGTYKWLLLPGTVLETTGRVGVQLRVRLDDALEAWVNADDALLLPEGTPAPRRVAGNARLVPAGDRVDVVIPMAERPAHEVRVGERSLSLVLHGVQANVDIASHRGDDPYVRRLTWVQETSDRARLDVALAGAPYGWMVNWERGSLVLRIRRPPAVDRAEPLKGLVIAVNAGHPPAGSTGPTGLYEGDAVLAISRRAQRLLEARGATVVMTRTTTEPLALTIRPVLARRANAHAFVSIHLNALPDGVNPFTSHGTGTYWYHAPSEPLARAVQRGMVARMGLRDLGTFYDNLSDLRHPWMPSVLTEGAFVIIPEQEAALRTAEFQERYAQGVVDGLAAYFRTLGAASAIPASQDR